MNMLRLLTAGKSLVDVKDMESPYRLTSQRLLPQFGPVRNPFSSRAESSPAQTKARSLGDHGGNGDAGEKRAIPSSGGESVAALQSGVQDQALSTGASGHGLTAALRLRAAMLMSGWRTRSSGLLDRPHGKTAKPVIPRFTKPPVQGELSLDKIKVVRNDLCDADLEVVPARRSAAPASAAPSLRTGERAGVVESAWGRVTTRVFGAAKTQSDED
jgi:hypothetical protein